MLETGDDDDSSNPSPIDNTGVHVGVLIITYATVVDRGPRIPAKLGRGETPGFHRPGYCVSQE